MLNSMSVIVKGLTLASRLSPSSQKFCPPKNQKWDQRR
uniref:Uncharacterized protein n=1 Tax=Anguilla anguilla TaxID=7936 RepID=A0A0E9QI72_ANGAN